MRSKSKTTIKYTGLPWSKCLSTGKFHLHDGYQFPEQNRGNLLVTKSNINISKKSFPLRLDPNIYSALEQWASEEIRSVNGHIEYLLRQALLKEKRIKKDGSLK